MEEKGSFLKRFGMIIIELIALLCITAGLILYGNGIRADLLTESCGILNNIAAQQRFAFSSMLTDQKNAIKIYATFFDNAPDLDDKRLTETMTIIKSNSSFDSFTYADANGQAIKDTGERLNVVEMEYFRRAIAGETVIGDPIVSRITNKYVVTFSAPVYRDGSIVAMIAGVYDAQHLAKMLMSSFGGKGYTYVTTGDGHVIFRTEQGQGLGIYDNLFGALSKVKYIELDDGETMLQKISEGESGNSRYSDNGENRFMRYDRVGINDWYMFSIAPEKSINPQLLRITHSTTMLIIIITLITALVLLYFLLISRRNVRELSRIAFVDSLTGSANKKQFKRDAARLLAASRCKYVMAIVDIDKFTVLNDTLGHKCGDEVLVDIARVMQSQIGSLECFGRCDSDEYYILLEYKSDMAVKERVQKIIGLIENGFAMRISATYNLVLCAGIYVITNPADPINSITDRARHAHRLIKGRDESGIRFYEDEMRNRILEENNIENMMHGALENEEFLLYLQPKYYLQDERIYGAEALVRWETETSTMMYPNNFIPLFEKNGFVTKLDMYMLEKACEKLHEWIEAGLRPIPVSINFSRLHLKNPNFVSEIARIADKFQIPPKYIEVELTESTMLDNEDVLIEVLNELHGYGFTLSMDDFGSGYSSLGLLKNLPVDVLKLDRTFFADYSELERAITVIAGIIDMAKSLGIKTVAEGVETKEQIDFLRTLGCDIVQGYYFAKPMPADKLDSMI